MSYAVFGKDKIIKVVFVSADAACRYADHWHLGVAPVSKDAESGAHLSRYVVPLSKNAACRDLGASRLSRPPYKGGVNVTHQAKAIFKMNGTTGKKDESK